MSRKDECIRELYCLLDKIAVNARYEDLSLVKTHHGATGCECHMGEPQICWIMDNILEEYGDIIRATFRTKEVEEWNRRAGE